MSAGVVGLHEASAQARRVATSRRTCKHTSTCLRHVPNGLLLCSRTPWFASFLLVWGGMVACSSY